MGNKTRKGKSTIVSILEDEGLKEYSKSQYGLDDFDISELNTNGQSSQNINEAGHDKDRDNKPDPNEKVLINLKNDSLMMN